MKQEAHLQVFDLTLTTRSPLFVGNGSDVLKNSYLFIPSTKTVCFFDMERFFEMLVEENKVDEYEKYIMRGENNFANFLRNVCKLPYKKEKSLYSYSVHAAEGVSDADSKKSIRTFMRRKEFADDGSVKYAAYIPGSSLKGALRTAVLLRMMKEEKRGQWNNGKRMTDLEGEYLNTLHLKKDKKKQDWANDAVNSLFRGISVSDSQSISDNCMILCGKTDAMPTGETHSINNLVRECVKPGTEIHFTLTLDTSVLKDVITVDYLRQCIQVYSSFYKKNYVDSFDTPKNTCDMRYDSILVLGGGSGFFAKTLAYPYLGNQDGLDYVAEEMQRMFRPTKKANHHHDKDISDYGISPHTMKYAKYNGLLYPYGVCGVTIR